MSVMNDDQGWDRKFVVDAMLKNIVSWLRILGYDAIYWGGEDDELLRLAKQERRIILTMDRDLALSALRNGLEVILIMENDPSDILANLASRYGISLEFNPNRTRCPICNHKLTLSRKEGREEWLCPNCGKRYWKGSHWKNIIKVFEDSQKKSGLI
ncbi:MAG: Mut7-C RNAse domain-containing protein [Nitrososphaeria archaeon]|nr:Mut7-C RNAse domain-containing protein [Nitrososphaeria archaeon]